VGWNCTGAVIGAALGRFDHEDWCTHKSTLCTWNINRRGLDPDKANVVIDVPSCLMCIHFHPQKPSYVVGGTFNGEWIVVRQYSAFYSTQMLNFPALFPYAMLLC
jgi:hypothetical protein